MHPLAGKYLIQHVIDTAQALNPTQIHVVVGHGADAVEQALAGQNLNFHQQTEQLGTGHAVACALPGCASNSAVLVLFGDVPLIAASTLKTLIAGSQDNPSMLAARLDDPTGLRAGIA